MNPVRLIKIFVLGLLATLVFSFGCKPKRGPCTTCADESRTATITSTHTPPVTFAPTDTLTPTFTLVPPIPTYTFTDTPTVPPPTPTFTFSFTPTSTAIPPTSTDTPTLTGLDISSFVSIGGGNYNYSYVDIRSGGTLSFSGPTTLTVTGFFTMESSSCTLNCSGYGSSNTGSPITTSNAGAGHGGAGGADGRGNAGGSTYDNTSSPTKSGSMGGYGSCSGYGAPGGGILQIVSGGPATLNGFITMNGLASFTCATYPTGAGSGGALFIQADSIEGNGTLEAIGGMGTTYVSDSTYNAGGGGGGIIVLSHHTSDHFAGSALVTGGTATYPASAGSAGVYSQTSY